MGNEVFDSSKNPKSTNITTVNNEEVFEYPLIQVNVKADVKLAFTDKKDKLFTFWFNTNMIDDYKFVLKKAELDGKARKDKEHLKYGPEFYVEVTLGPDPTSPPLVLEPFHKKSGSISSPLPPSVLGTTPTTTTTTTTPIAQNNQPFQ